MLRALEFRGLWCKLQLQIAVFRVARGAGHLFHQLKPPFGADF